MKALILSGGGARGAYQVGVLKAVGEIANREQVKNPFQIYTGVSAGSINAAFMASSAHDFFAGSQLLVDLWTHLKSEDVFRTDAVSLGRIGLQWMTEISLGGMTQGASARALLDTEPLRELLLEQLNLNQIQENIEQRHLHALAVTALDYQSSETVTFWQGHESVQSWNKIRRRSQQTRIRAEHVLASSSIPVLFPSTEVAGRHYGDGCVRNDAPISPALHLGATEVFVIGVRMMSEVSKPPGISVHKAPSIARVANVLLNSVLLDGVEIDVERLNRINEFLRRVPSQHQTNLNFKPVPALFISPSQDIGRIAAEMSSRLPRVIRYLIKGLGPLEEASEIISYLLFETEFTSRLIEIGYEDGLRRQSDITRFLLESRPQSLDWEGF